MSTPKRVLLIVVLAGVGCTLAWIAAINMIDASLIVAGRVVDPSGKPQVNSSVAVHVGNRVITRETNDRGCFFVGTTTTFLKHECRLVISAPNAIGSTSLSAPGRHFLQINARSSQEAWAFTAIDQKVFSNVCN